MALHVCKECGKQFLCESDKYICPDCLAAKPKTTLAPRSCKTCGNIFIGGPRAWYCPSCRAERQRERQNANRGKKTRPLGSIDLCEVCGKEYTVNGGLQRYCPDCAEKTIKENVQARKREYMAENRDRIREITRPQKTCVICGVLLPPKTNCITCGSPECIEARRKQQQRAGAFYRGKSTRYPEGYVPTKKNSNSRNQPPAQPEKIYKAKSDITGQKFGYLTAIRPTTERKNSNVVWEFQCECGTLMRRTVSQVRTQMKMGHIPSCGCKRGTSAKDLTGQKFGCLTAMCPTDERENGSVVWEFACECGNTVHFSAGYVKAQTRKGTLLSCGCMTPKGRKAQDLTGQKFGYLTAMHPTNERQGHSVVWEFACDCGNTIHFSTAYVKAQTKKGKPLSCGCMTPKGRKALDITGQKFGYLTAIRPTTERKGSNMVWEFQCECGNIVRLNPACIISRIKKGQKPSCGCMTQKGRKAKDMNTIEQDK